MLLIPKMSAYQNPSRTPTLRRNVSGRTKDITDSPNRVDDLLFWINLAANPMNQHVDDVCLRIKTVIEDVFQDHRLGHDTVWMTHQIFKQREFPRLEFNFLSVALHFAREQIER